MRARRSEEKPTSSGFARRVAALPLLSSITPKTNATANDSTRWTWGFISAPPARGILQRGGRDRRAPRTWAGRLLAERGTARTAHRNASVAPPRRMSPSAAPELLSRARSVTRLICRVRLSQLGDRGRRSFDAARLDRHADVEPAAHRLAVLPSRRERPQVHGGYDSVM